MKCEVLYQSDNGKQTVLTLKNFSLIGNYPSIASIDNQHYLISAYRYGQYNSVVLNSLINSDLTGKEIYLS